MTTDLLLFYLLSIIVSFYTMMIEILAQRNHSQKLKFFSESSTINMDINPFIVLFRKYRILKNLMLLLKSLKLLPLLLETLWSFLSQYFYWLFGEFIYVLFKPESDVINILWKMMNHLVPNAFLFFLIVNINNISV